MKRFQERMALPEGVFRARAELEVVGKKRGQVHFLTVWVLLVVYQDASNSPQRSRWIDLPCH